MSTDLQEKNSGEDGHLTIAVPGQSGSSGDVDDTPRSEAPPALDVTTPRTSEAAAVAQSIDYFSQPAVIAAAEERQHVERTSVATGHHTSDATSASSRGANASDNLQPSESTSTPEAALSPRPTAQHTPSSLSIDSVESADSTATVRPFPPPERLPYPDQRFEALQHQNHGTYHTPPIQPNQRRPAHPPFSPVATFASAIASHHSNGIPTEQSSPATTPHYGLFRPSSTTPAASSSTYPSPFLLHHTHRPQMPRETNIADIEVDLITGRKVINNYEIIDELGRGTHGKVKFARNLNFMNVYVAIKIVERFSKRRKLGRLGTTEDKVKKEVAILKKARHPNVVSLLEVIDDPSRKKVYIVLEWVERGEISWRSKAPKEIAMVEARRYERESREAKTGNRDDRLAAQDRAVLEEATKRLNKLRRRYLRGVRKMREDDQGWSIEMAGDDDFSDDAEEDRLSRISSITGEMSAPLATQATQWLDTGAGRRISRTPSPLMPTLDTTPARPTRFLRLTEEPETISPTSEPLDISRSPDFSLTGLEGTMYGAYDPTNPNSRDSSLPNSLRGSQHGSVEDLSELAHEVLGSHLDTELEYVPTMSMSEIRAVFRETLLGLQYLHHQGIIHRDIKPPNLLVTREGHVKISDFGVSYLGRPIHNDEGEDVSEAEALDLDDEAKELAKTVGTPAFYAPELCSIDPTDEPLPVTKAIDIWALGITLFCMLFARTPFVENEYVVMRSIAEEEVYIPAQRLLPVKEEIPKSRPSSRSRNFSPQWVRKRNEHQFVYEDLGDDLLDLLHKLLIKDPRKRITMEEIRHHPWVLADISNQPRWFDESDPSHQQEHSKIEISNEELKTAVVPLNLYDRARFALKKVKDGVVDAVIGTSTRARGISNASSPVPSAHSSSSTISQDARRPSLRGGNEEIIPALRASHGEHPLSKSQAASPELEEYDKNIPRLNGKSDSSMRRRRIVPRPSPPHRAMTVTSNTPSMRTVTQSDYQKSKLEKSPPPSPSLLGMPQEVASPGGSHFSGLLGMINSVRARSRHSSRSRRGPSSDRGSDRGSVQSSDAHGEASVAISGATATGHVQQPDVLRGDSNMQSSAHNSPASSRSQSVTSDQQHLRTPGVLSRLSSNSSLASAGRYVSERTSRPRLPNESTPEEHQHAKDELVRRRVNEGLNAYQQQLRAEMANATSSESCTSPTSPPSRTCPHSPDDDDDYAQHQISQVPSLTEMSTPATPDEALSPTGTAGQLPPALVSSSSDFGSAVSMSISNPSIPSVISEASSVDDLQPEHNVPRKESSDDTLNPAEQYSHSADNYDEGYTPDEEATLNSDDDDDFDSSSDSDGGLQMHRRKSAASKTLPISKERRGTGLSIRSKKSSRSGSSNTMKKVRTRESSDEQGRRSLDVHQE